MKRFALIVALCLLAGGMFAQQQELEPQTIGPKNGSLVIVGGAMRSDAILDRFIELAGGKDAFIVVIPTAGGQSDYDHDFYFIERLKARGVKEVHLLHTRDPKVADTREFVEPLRHADGVWFTGGRQWRLVDAYAGTLTQAMLDEVLARDGVIGGSSAGATIQGSYLVRGDTQTNQIIMGDHEVGFNYLKNTAIDQHVLARNRQFDLFEIIQAKPELLGIGLDENTAIVVQGNEFEVIGEHYVLVYDGTFYSREGYDMKKLPEASQIFYFLRAGDKYDLLKRKVKN